jgi:hypothetical protein
MKDNKHIVTIDTVDYSIQRTFSNDVAIYISVKPGVFVHIGEYLKPGGRKGLDIKSICAGLKDQDECFILAHLADNEQKPECKTVIDGIGYVVDLARDKAPAIFLSSGDGEVFYNIRDYGQIVRTVASPEDILLRPEHNIFGRRGQVVIVANVQFHRLTFLVNDEKLQ